MVFLFILFTIKQFFSGNTTNPESKYIPWYSFHDYLNCVQNLCPVIKNFKALSISSWLQHLKYNSRNTRTLTQHSPCKHNTEHNHTCLCQKTKDCHSPDVCKTFECLSPNLHQIRGWIPIGLSPPPITSYFHP